MFYIYQHAIYAKSSKLDQQPPNVMNDSVSLNRILSSGVKDGEIYINLHLLDLFLLPSTNVQLYIS